VSVRSDLEANTSFIVAALTPVLNETVKQVLLAFSSIYETFVLLKGTVCENAEALYI